MTKAQFRKAILYVALGLAALGWVVLAVAIIAFDLPRTHLLALGVGVGVLTEVAMWTGAVVGGWTILANRKALFKRWFSLKSSEV